MPVHLRSQFGTDPTLENDGRWVALGDGAEIRVARWLNDRHRAAAARLREPYKAFDLAGRDLPADVALEITIGGMAEAVLVDWKGLVDDDGQPLPYSTEAAAQELKIKDFREFVINQATNAGAYRDAEVAATVKNS
jgi:hypothetical protein